MISIKQFWLSGEWRAPAILYHKILLDLSRGRWEFKPPDWETFRP